MDKVVELEPGAQICVFCHKKKAVNLCDAITGHSRYAGHPPKIDGVLSKEPMEKVHTCDKPICEKCSTKVTPYMDLCPEHSEPLIKNNRKG